jgi:hypothetical protein
MDHDVIGWIILKIDLGEIGCGDGVLTTLVWPGIVIKLLCMRQ